MPKSWANYFLIYWATAVISLYPSWLVFHRKNFLDVLVFYMTSTFILALIVAFREQRNFMKYLKHHHLKKWEEITTFPLLGGGPGGYNSIRALGFVYGNDDLNDPILKHLKENFKAIIPWAFVVPVSHVCLMLFLLYVGVIHKVS